MPLLMLLWAPNPACLCLPASSPIHPNQRSAFFKGNLPDTLAGAFGYDGAARIQPPTYGLHSDFDVDRLLAVLRSPGGPGAWVIKRMMHRGKGVEVRPGWCSTAGMLPSLTTA